MGWSWRLEGKAGARTEVAGARQPEGGFPSQGEAETWLSEIWAELAAQAVTAVSLYEEGRLVYGPMSLRP